MSPLSCFGSSSSFTPSFATLGDLVGRRAQLVLAVQKAPPIQFAARVTQHETPATLCMQIRPAPEFQSKPSRGSGHTVSKPAEVKRADRDIAKPKGRDPAEMTGKEVVLPVAS